MTVSDLLKQSRNMVQSDNINKLVTGYRSLATNHATQLFDSLFVDLLQVVKFLRVWDTVCTAVPKRNSKIAKRHHGWRRARTFLIQERRTAPKIRLYSFT